MAKQKQSKARHYVPVWLLKRFCDEHERLWWRRSDWPREKVLPGSPSAVFHENNLNTRYAADGSRDVHVENDLAALDGRIAEITACLVEQCRQGRSPDLDKQGMAFLRRFMFVQFKRPPELWEGSGDTHNERVEAVLKPSMEVSQVLKTKGICLWSVPSGSALLIGSQVVLRAGSGRPGRLEEPDHGLAFPLASDVLLGFFHGACRRDYDVLSASEVDAINRATAHHCIAVAGPDRWTVLRAAI